MNKKVLTLIFVIFITFIGIMKIDAKVIDSVNILDYGGGFATQGFGSTGQTCAELLKPNLMKLLKFGINTLRTVGAIIAIVKGMMLLVPPIMNGDAKALQSAGKKCMNLGIVLLLIGIFPTIVSFVGTIFGYDLSCF